MYFKKIFKIEFSLTTMESLKKKDGIISLIYFAYYMIYLLAFGLIVFNTSIYSDIGKLFSNNTLTRFIFYLPFTVISILPILIILKLRKQKLVSIGLTSCNTYKSVLIGIIGAIPFSLLNISGPIQAGRNINTNLFELIFTFLYFLICIAFVEELVFRGFIQTRILKLIKVKWISIIVVGLLFSISHIPFQMMRMNMNLIEFLIYDLRHLITTCIIHIYLVYLYTRYNNLTAVIITHTLMDFSYAIFI